MRHSYFPLGKQSICSSANKAGAGPLSIRVEASGWDELGNYTEPSANFFSSRLRKSRPVRPPSIASTSSACPIRTSRWHPKRQGGSLPLRPGSDSAAFAPASTTSLAGEGRAAGITCASVVGVELHMHPDVGVCSIGKDELIAISSAPPATRARGAAGAGLVEWTRIIAGPVTAVGGYRPAHSTVELEVPLGKRPVLDAAGSPARPRWPSDQDGQDQPR